MHWRGLYGMLKVWHINAKCERRMTCYRYSFNHDFVLLCMCPLAGREACMSVSSLLMIYKHLILSKEEVIEGH